MSFLKNVNLQIKKIKLNLIKNKIIQFKLLIHKAKIMVLLVLLNAHKIIN